MEGVPAVRVAQQSNGCNDIGAEIKRPRRYMQRAATPARLLAEPAAVPAAAGNGLPAVHWIKFYVCGG